MTMTRRALTGAGFAMALTLAAGGGAFAQDISIQDNGGNVNDSQAGASNVRMERNPGQEQALEGAGQGNQNIRRERQQRERERQDRGNRGGDGMAAPAEEWVDPNAAGWAPAPEWVEPAPAAQPAPAQVGGAPAPVIALPSTGAGSAGIGGILPAIVAAGAAAAAFAGGRIGLRRE